MLRKRLRRFANLTIATCGVLALLPQAPALAASAPALAASAPSLAASQGPYNIIGESSNRCIDVPHGTTENVQVIIYGCKAGAVNQYWHFNDSYPGYYYIKNDLTGKCLNVQGASQQTNAAIIQYPCSAVDNERWYPRLVAVSGPTDYYHLVSLDSALCITAAGNGTANSVKLVQSGCDPSNYSQLWTWKRPAGV